MILLSNLVEAFKPGDWNAAMASSMLPEHRKGLLAGDAALPPSRQRH